MKRILQTILVAFLMCNIAFAQTTTIFDFEMPTNQTFGTFGSNGYDLPLEVIANPDPSGINTSDSVTEFIKYAGAQTWTGAFADTLYAPIDLTNGGKICMDIWAPRAGNAAVKLESSVNGAANWILTQTFTQTNEWIQLCFDSAIPSIEAPFAGASGDSYYKFVVFFNFGDNSNAANESYYFDNVIVDQSVDNTEYATTFRVDMSEFTEPFTVVNLMGDMNAWSQDGNPLTDMGNGIWEVTIDLPIGAYQYKYNVSNAGIFVEEDFPAYRECSQLSFGADGTVSFSNRIVTISGATVIPTHLYTSCYSANDDVVNLTYHLNMASQYVSNLGVYLAGGANYLPQGKYRLTPNGTSDFYSITFQRLNGFTPGHFSFVNGLCPSLWDCKEDITGQSCADPNNFNDRFDGNAITSDYVYSSCFADCSITGNCLFVEPVDTTGGTNIIAFEEGAINIKPTLVNNELLVSINGNYTDLQLNIVNAAGQVKISENLTSTAYSFDLSEFSQGIYIVEIANETYYTTQKIIKL